MIIGDLFEELVEYSSLDSLVPLDADRDRMLEDEIDTLVLDRCREHDWSIREEVELLREIMHIPLKDRVLVDSWLVHHLVPLVDDEDDSLLFFHRFTDDMLVLMSHSLERIDHDRDDIGSLHGLLRSHHTPLLDIG